MAENMVLDAEHLDTPAGDVVVEVKSRGEIDAWVAGLKKVGDVLSKYIDVYADAVFESDNAIKEIEESLSGGGGDDEESLKHAKVMNTILQMTRRISAKTASVKSGLCKASLSIQANTQVFLTAAIAEVNKT